MHYFAAEEVESGIVKKLQHVKNKWKKICVIRYYLVPLQRFRGSIPLEMRLNN